MQSIATDDTEVALSYRLLTLRKALQTTGCELAHTSCNRYAGTIDWRSAVNDYRRPDRTDAVTAPPRDHTTGKGANGSKRAYAYLTLRIRANRPPVVSANRARLPLRDPS